MPHTTQSGSDAIWITTRLAVYIRDGWTCFVCGCRVTHHRSSNQGTRASLDHIQPGHNHRPTNLITMCVPCNTSKTARHLKKWRPDLYEAAKKQARRKLDREAARALARDLGYSQRLDRRRY